MLDSVNQGIPDSVKWRSDDRCGNEFLALNGLPAQCDPQGGLPCCSKFGYCGNTLEHCNCPECFDYRKGTPQARN